MFFLYIFKGYKILLWDTKSFWPSLKAIIPNMNKLSKAVNNCNNEEDMWTYLKNSNATSVSGEILQFFFIRKNLTCKKLLISRFFLNVFFRCLSIRRFIFKYPIHRYNVGDLITVRKFFDFWWFLNLTQHFWLPYLKKDGLKWPKMGRGNVRLHCTHHLELSMAAKIKFIIKIEKKEKKFILLYIMLILVLF